MNNLCKQCGDTDPDKFYKSNKSTCKKCQIERSKNRYHNLSETDKQAYKDNANKNFKEWVKINTLQFRFTQARSRAKRNGLDFTITLSDLECLLESQNGECYYSGRQMTQCREGIDAISLDRLDSTIGYTPSNIVLCTWAANIMKCHLSVPDFISLINDIYTLNRTKQLPH